MKTDKRIFLYMEGELSPEEKISFEKELKNSPELQNEIKLYRDFFSVVEVTKNVSPKTFGKNQAKEIFSQNCLCFPGFGYFVFGFVFHV